MAATYGYTTELLDMMSGTTGSGEIYIESNGTFTVTGPITVGTGTLPIPPFKVHYDTPVCRIDKVYDMFVPKEVMEKEVAVQVATAAGQVINSIDFGLDVKDISIDITIHGERDPDTRKVKVTVDAKGNFSSTLK